MRYFIVSYYQQPNGKYNEAVKTDDKIRKRDAQSASLILDYKERKVIKARLDSGMERNFDNISNFYKNHYAGLILQLEATYPVIKNTFVANNQTVMPIETKEEEVADGESESS